MELKVSEADAGERLDAFLAAPLGSRARAQRLIEAGAVLVDGAAVPKRHRIAAGEVVVVDEDAEQLPVGDPSQTADFTVAFEDEHLLVIDKPAGVVVHPAPRPLARDARAGARGPRGRRRRRVPGGDRAPPGPRHLRPARGGEVRRGAHRAEGGAGAPRDGPRVPRARRGAPAGARRGRSTRRSAATAASARATPPTPTSRARRSRTSRSSARCRRPRCCGCACRPAAPTRSASTCRRSATRSAAIPSTGTPGLYGLERQFLHAEHLAFTHPVTGDPVDVHSPLPEDLAAALERAA